jgi:uncharacterized protein with PIN domain
VILYLDTSALVKLYVREAGTSETRARVGEASLVATSRVAYPEARAALARRQREAAITQRGFDAIPLASALEVEELTGLMPGFCCYDVRLREAASGEGLPAH